MGGALEGLKVLDMTRVLAGPYCTMILADMGADVIKVEAVGTGDDSRQFGPYINGESAYFMNINRNKRSVTMNLKNKDSVALLKELAKKSDILVENFKPGTMERLGLGYDELKGINPGLIYAAASGFGHTGPYRDRPAYDAVVQAMGGIMSITGQEGGPPTRVGSSIGDITAGLFCAIGILAAAVHRKETGEGQKVDVAMLDCQIAILENAVLRYLVTGISPKPLGNRHPSIVPFESFETGDGVIMVAARNNSLWAKYCRAIGREGLAADPRFDQNPKRAENYGELRPLLAEAMLARSTAEWQGIFEEAGVPSSPVNDIGMALRNEQVIARDMLVDSEHPIAGRTKLPGIPIKMDKTPGEVRFAAPTLGQHTEEVLKGMLSLDDMEIKRLRDEGAI